MALWWGVITATPIPPFRRCLPQSGNTVLSAVRQEEAGRILLEAMKSGIPFTELQQIYQEGMLPIELREKILPLMQGREAVPEKIGEKMEFITEAVRDLKESFLMQNSFIEELRKTMEEKPDIFSAREKAVEGDADIYDTAFRTVLNDYSGLIIPLINISFGEYYISECCERNG